MNLEEAMAEVQRYLHAIDASGASGLAAPTPPRTNSLGPSITRLGRLAARSGVIERNGKGGVLAWYLKRIIRKAIGWYIRPIHEFDQGVVEALEFVRQDVLKLEQQMSTITQRPTITAEDPLRATIELLFANIAAIQSLQQALTETYPEMTPRIERSLESVQNELASLKAALLDQLPPGQVLIDEKRSLRRHP